MLSDYEAAEIERRFREGEKGPIAITWVQKLLEDRRERIARQEYVRGRIKAAFEYLDKLQQSTVAQMPANGRICPKCSRPYDVARPHASSRGKIYVHPDQKQCVVLSDS